MQLLDEAGNSYIVHVSVARLYCLTRTQHRVLKVTKGPVSLSLDGLLDPVGSEVEHGRTNDGTSVDVQEN